MQTTQQLCPPQIRELIARCRADIEPLTDALLARALELGTETAEVLGALTEDPDLARAALVKPLIGPAGFTAERLAALAGETAAQTALDLARVDQLWSPHAGAPLDPAQAEALRKMMLAVASDPKLVLARLAEQLVALRHARELSVPEQERLAMEVRTLSAPLASRLGISQLKWELEDLAFRYLEPTAYHQLAATLNERRSDRERYIQTVCDKLSMRLAKAGIQAEVYGRPKHMYSIHRKMQRKHLAFEQLFDIRAVRVLVKSVRDCYAALGIVHGLWPYIPGEFDDYIATPKPNGYRSIHTAVTGPQGRNVEVQIRTPEMHEHAELGVAAHWAYKEGGGRDALYQRKIEWARRLLQPRREEADEAERDELEGMRKALFEDRVYALTPKGEVIDLPAGATPLDFAYAVHTSLGHRCRGARLNGRIVPLTAAVPSGAIVEIITAKQEAPSRSWLDAGYLASPRAKAKVRAWFRRNDAGDARQTGRQLAERELARVGARTEQLTALAAALQAHDTEHLYEMLGEGAITPAQLARAADKLVHPQVQPAPPPRRARVAARASAAARRARPPSPVWVEGVTDLPTTLARCCVPLRPQPITGYLTPGRGVVVHRSDCASLARMREAKPERVFTVQWSTTDAADLSVAISVHAHDRQGLVRDVSDVIAHERLSIEAMNTATDHDTGIAHLQITVNLDDMEQLERVLRRLTGVPDVTRARRVR